MRSKNLRKRLVSLQVFLTLIVLLVAWVFITINDYNILKGLKLQRYEVTVKILSRNLSKCLIAKDQEECLRVLKTLMDEKLIRSAVLTDNQGNVFASYNFDSDELSDYGMTPGKNGYRYILENKEIVSSYPVNEGNDYLGRIYIRGEFDIVKTFGQRHGIVFILILMTSLVFCFYLSGYMQKTISSQFSHLLSAMKRIRNEKKYNLRVQHSESWKNVDVAEFRELGETFDSMIEQIEIRDQSMKLQNENLEKIIEEKVQEILRSAELASLGEMAGGIAHEINNPLTIITSTNRVLLMLLEKEKFDKEQFTKLVSNVDQTVARIAKIVNGLRNISRRSTEQDISECCFSEVFNDISEVAEAKFKSKGISIRKTYSDEEALTPFMANRIQLSQVLINLLNNSYDAVVDLKNTELWIEVSIRRMSTHVILRVTDSGPGISPEIRQKMFNPFFTTKEIGKGTGIGLPLSKSMIEKMGGSFQYDESIPNTSFVISLPLVGIKAA